MQGMLNKYLTFLSKEGEELFGKELTRGSKVIGRILFSFLIAVVLLTFGIRLFDSQGLQKREQGLISEFQAIVHPNDAEQVSFEMRSKILKRWILANYRYRLNAAELENYYDHELLQKGWSKVPVSKTEYETFHHFKYKKGDYEIIFRPFKDSWVIQMNLRDFYDKLG
ncbi:hypothetical protein [Pelosinus propionicus]|uniref:Uncharacterized protein n=1 Tax=Pelosinus propionicus DSM 13327 TaxID=1123291 RepID=A0A1I4Q8S2_9FIRM|nr:hypothetical protein [Pelosinus propionicus]SFM36033.1 hypothetical protein SAMN04490355_10872 [Pelosinus propionicus DSM 13327]